MPPTLQMNSFLAQTVMAVGFFSLVIAQISVRGLAALAAGGVYGSDKSSVGYFHAENYLLVAVLWLLFGIPNRAFKYKLDPAGKGKAQYVLLGFLAVVASVVTGTTILLLHFGGGPLCGVDIRLLVAGTIFTVFLLVPIYKSWAKACWQHGFFGMFSLKPWMRHWSEASADVGVTFEQAAQRVRDRNRRNSTSEKAVRGVAGVRAPSRPEPSRSGSPLQSPNSGKLVSMSETADNTPKLPRRKPGRSRSSMPSRNPGRAPKKRRAH